MSDIVERVAQALYQDYMDERDWDSGAFWADLSFDNKQKWREYAQQRLDLENA